MDASYWIIIDCYYNPYFHEGPVIKLTFYGYIVAVLCSSGFSMNPFWSIELGHSEGVGHISTNPEHLPLHGYLKKKPDSTL